MSPGGTVIFLQRQTSLNPSVLSASASGWSAQWMAAGSPAFPRNFPAAYSNESPFSVLSPAGSVNEKWKATLVYSNATGRSWKFNSPETTRFVRVWFRQVGAERKSWFTIAQNRTTEANFPGEGRVVATLAPQGTPVTLDRGMEHRVEWDLANLWSAEGLPPGRWELWIEDEKEGLESKRVRHDVVFQSDSVLRLLAVAQDEKESRQRRQWHAEWLQKVKPDLNLDWPREKDPEAVKKQKEYRVQLALKDFERFWEREKDSQAVADAIRKINEDAGLKADK